MALTAKQERFVQEYLIDFNGKQAAIRAGYSARRAEVTASELLADRKVSEAVALGRDKANAKAELTADLVKRSILQELTFDPAKLYSSDGQLLQIPDLPEDIRMALTAVEFEQHGSPEAPVYVRKVKWAQKQGAREQAMKHLGMFEKDNKQKRGVQELPEDQLDRLIAQKAKEAGVTVH